MVDKFSKEKRSWIMSRIRSKDTKIELFVFRELRRRKIYFQKNYKKALGSPDIALPRVKKAVFIDGDFWHGYKYKQWKNRLPSKFWKQKIERNIRRDKIHKKKLKSTGWKVLRIWGHRIKKHPDKTIDSIVDFLMEK
jgi:DNA mismatch endonuclease (patch repair protein)